jgi:hypothetical protein
MHDDVWRAIRALRATPPVRPDAADKAKRCATFRAALRQAEELADAAAAVGYTTRALPLFYAMEQAGLAIAAAKSQEPSSATSHGLKFHRDHRQRNILLGEIRSDGGLSSSRLELVAPRRPAKGAFQVAAEATGSPSLASAASLGELWAANPDLIDVPVPRQLGAWDRPIIHELGTRRVPNGDGSCSDPENAFLSTGGSVKLTAGLQGATVGDVEALLKPYPSLHDVQAFAEVPGRGGAGADFGRQSDRVYRRLQGRKGYPCVILGRRASKFLSFAEHWRQEDALFSFVEVDDRQPIDPHPSWVGYALPKVGGDSSPSPLLLWWALLLGFSSLVRYHAAAWTSALDFDKEPLAVHLHGVLDIAAERVPARLLSALTA